ncbi:MULTISPECIES: CD3324 family protein [Sporomusa]|jgi:Mor family transcriptional regulator|uniref:CD3324 family protein n=1 Tax=Sporomusa TaxID=2375 RepID=UPI001667A860|nr:MULTISPECIES: CD3324 family protein [Sporomusa]MCM0760449.1 CD3324 family protein [Sporomusa sphaeroides DSM 2875]HML33233.1 CD3324 family protein [Sporomusa sphaeroides]
MGYKNAICVLPDKLIAAIQEYIDGEYLYIPRKVENKKSWGELKNTRNFLSTRNKAIFDEYRNGISVEQLAADYYLSPKTVYKIIQNEK